MTLKERFSFVLFICLFFSGPVLSETKKLTADDNNFILILSSYEYGYEWGTTVAKSIRTELEKNNSDLLVNISYADIADRKSFLSGRLGMQAAFSNGRLSPAHSFPAVLVIIGDEAWMYYRIMNLRGLWDDIPVVLVGVNAEILPDYSGYFPGKVVISDSLVALNKTFKSFNIHALLRDENTVQTVDLMKKLMPELENILFVSRNNYQDQLLAAKFESCINSEYPGLNMQVISYHKEKADSIKKILGKIPANTVLVDTSDFPDDEVAVPVFVVEETILEGKNIIGGYYSSIPDYSRQAANIILDIFEKGDTVSGQEVIHSENVLPHLNKMALEFWGMSKNASSIEEKVYENIPLSFFERYKRIILMVTLIVLILVVIAILIIRNSHYRRYLQTSLDDYKKLYEEYQVIYENTPMGLVQFDVAGNVLKYNPVGREIIRIFTQADIRDFNIYKSDIPGYAISEKIRNKENIDNIFLYGDKAFQIVIKYITNGLIEKDTTLMILIDVTEIQQEKKFKEEIYSVFSFAMNLASLGLAEYNLLDGGGFATEAWYTNFGISKNTNFLDTYQHVVEEDLLKIHNFIQDLKDGKRESFLDNIRVNVNGKIHWFSYVLQLIEYAPVKGRIIVAALALNIDKQKKHETALARAISLISESDKMKNAFIANMSSEIKPSLDELVRASTELTQSNDKDRKKELMQCIEKNNEILLEYILRIIDLSHSGGNTPNL